MNHLNSKHQEYKKEWVLIIGIGENRKQKNNVQNSSNNIFVESDIEDIHEKKDNKKIMIITGNWLIPIIQYLKIKSILKKSQGVIFRLHKEQSVEGKSFISQYD